MTIFFNHLSLVDQGIHKYVLCGRFSVFHMRQIKYSVTLPSSVITRPLVLFIAIKIFIAWEL